MITSNTLSYALDEVVSAAAFESFFEQAFMMPMLYSVRPSGRRRERSASFGGLGDFEEKSPSAAAAETSLAQQYEKDFVHVAYALQVPIERELLDDEEYGFAVEVGRQIGIKAAYKMELLAAALFHDAFAGATYKAEDALSICNSAHVNSDSGNSQGNTGTSALSLAAIKSTRTAMRNCKNYRGDLLSVMPDALLIPHDLEETAWEIVRSTGRPDTTNNAANFYNGMFKLFVWPFLSTGVSGGDANNWFMLDTRLLKQNLIWYQRVPLEVFGDGDLFKGTRRIGGYFRASHGLRDWRGIYGHNVT